MKMQLTVGIEPETAAALKKAAEKNKRSVSSQANFILYESLFGGRKA